MGNTEDYLDSLLNSINHADMANKNHESEEPIEDTEEAFRRFEREQEYKRERRKKKEEEQKREEAFLEEFEDELSDVDTDEFLQQFEMELDEDNGGNAQRQSSNTDEFFDNLKGIVSDASVKGNGQASATGPATVASGSASGSQQNAAASQPMAGATPQAKEEPVADIMGASLMDSLSGADGASDSDGPAGKAGGNMESPLGDIGPDFVSEEDLSGDESDNGDLLDLLSGIDDNEDISEIGDLLKANDENVELEESSLDASGGTSLGAELGAILSGEGEEEETGKKGKKKGEKKPGFFARLMKALFGEDEPEDAENAGVNIPEARDLENISEENLQILKELEEAEKSGAGAPDKKEKKKKKKEKKEKKAKPPKEKKEKKKREKKVKEPKPKVVDNTPPLPKKPVILIFVFAFSALALVLLVLKGVGNDPFLEAAQESIDNGNYVEAYAQLVNLDLNENDAKLYDRAEAVATVQAEYQAYMTLMGANKYSMALDALVRGIGRYDKNLENAKKYGLQGELDEVKAQLTEALSNQFGMTEDEARELYAIRDREEYSIAIYKKIQGLNMAQN